MNERVVEGRAAALDVPHAADHLRQRLRSKRERIVKRSVSGFANATVVQLTALMSITARRQRNYSSRFLSHHNEGLQRHEAENGEAGRQLVHDLLVHEAASALDAAHLDTLQKRKNQRNRSSVTNPKVAIALYAPLASRCPFGARSQGNRQLR